MRDSLEKIRGYLTTYICLFLFVFLSSCATNPPPAQKCLFDKKAISKTLEDAEAGKSEAQLRVASWYRDGGCLSLNVAKSIEWYEMAANQGDLRAYFPLASMYRFHLEDMEKAIYWYKKAGEAGDISAQRELGFLYQKGVFIEKDLNESEKWSALAAGQGDVSSAQRLKSLEKERQKIGQREQKLVILKEQQLRQAIENRRNVLEKLKAIGIVWSKTDPNFLKERSNSHSEASDAEARGYLYGPMAIVSWPAWLLTAVVVESGVAATKSAEHTYMQNTVRKIFDESNIQTFFMENLLEAASEQLDNPVTVLEKLEETQNYFDEIGVNTILELKNGLVKIIAKTNHGYYVLVEVEYRIIDTETQNVMNIKTIKSRGETFTVTRSSVSDEEEDIDTKLARQSLEVAYQKLANSIIESVLDLP